jgi:hypothetical protein
MAPSGGDAHGCSYRRVLTAQMGIDKKSPMIGETVFQNKEEWIR